MIKNLSCNRIFRKFQNLCSQNLCSMRTLIIKYLEMILLHINLLLSMTNCHVLLTNRHVTRLRLSKFPRIFSKTCGILVTISSIVTKPRKFMCREPFAYQLNQTFLNSNVMRGKWCKVVRLWFVCCVQQ